MTQSTAIELALIWFALGTISLCLTAATDDSVTCLKILTAYTVGPMLVAWVVLRGAVAAVTGVGE